MRFLLLFLVSTLLLNPLINYIERITIPPKIVFVLDNSASIKKSIDKETLFTKIQQLKTKLEQEENEVLLRTIDNKKINTLDSLQFDLPMTDLSHALTAIQRELEEENLQSIVLFSDGLQNKGTNPLYKNYHYPIHTVGLGDTTISKDIILQKVNFNQKVSPNTEIPLDLLINFEGFSGEPMSIEVLSNDEKKYTTTIETTTGSSFIKKRIYLQSPAKEGVYEYLLKVKAKEGEYTIENNQKKIIFQVIEKKQHILIAASSPHPDIRAIKTALLNDERNIVDIFISSNDDIITSKNYSLVVFYGLPNRQNIGNKVVEQLIESSQAHFFVLSSQTDISKLNTYNDCMKVMPKLNQKDKITPLYNPSFGMYHLEHKDFYATLPPISVPFADYQLKASTHVVLRQKVGSILTEKPLLAINLSRTKPSAVLVGEGFWSWRAISYDHSKEIFLLDELLLKTSQLLCTTQNKKRFQCKPQKKIYSETEAVNFDVSLYNALYEPVADAKLNIALSKNGKLIQKKDVQLGLEAITFTSLSAGKYTYEAKTQLYDTTLVDKGFFVVEKLNLELFHHRANHTLLRELSEKTAATTYSINELSTFNNIESKAKIKTREDIVSIIKYKIVFFVILLLVTIEWIIRKTKDII